jgi:G:T-mismatch repair DNA endonuclease (very short patch repair protein)
LVVKQLLDDNGINYTNNDRSVISPYELDFYLPDYNLAIEINGLYWHSSRLKSNDYHFNKWNMCKKLGIDLYSIFEDDFTVNETMWKNKILHLCSKVPHQKIYARKCEVKEVDSRM